jgi:plasmid maintenance system antidote protein VapI
MPRFNKMLANVSKPIPHNGQLLAQVMNQRMMTVPKLARKMGIAPNGIRQYCKLPSLHAALLWKLGEILQYNFFAVLSTAFPLQSPSEKELELQQQLTDLKKENELYKNLLTGKLGR